MFNRDEWILEQQNPMISKKKWQTTVNLIAKLYEAPMVYVIQKTSRGLKIVISSNTPVNPYQSGEEFQQYETMFSQQVIDSGEQLYINHASSAKDWKTNPVVKEHSVNSYLGVPIYWPDGSCFGAICVLDFAVTHYNKTYLELIWQFRDLVEADLLLATQFLQLLDLSTKDDLTGLLNRQSFYIQSEKQVRLAQRSMQNIGVLYLDMHEMKKVNDQHGHRIGDKAICALTTAIRTVLGENDLAGRVGGDEFAIVMLAPDQQTMAKQSAKIRSELAALCTGELENIKLHVSIAGRLFRPNELTGIDKMASELEEIMLEEKSSYHARSGSGNAS